MKLSELAANVAQSTQAAVQEWAAEHGRARGLFLFARRVGVTERRARSLLEGTAGRIDAAEYIAAQQARAEILRLRIARAELHLQEIEVAHGSVVEPPRSGASQVRDSAGRSRRVVSRSGATAAGA